jgi:hypothetical protein
MKKDVTKLVGVVLSLVIAGGMLKAQPDLGVAGKGENPANRDAAQRAAQREAARAARKAPNQRALDKLAERETARQELKLERLPRYLNAYGIRDEKIQQAVQAHLKASLKERENITRVQYQLRRLLVMPNTIEAQIKAASADLIQAEKSYEAAFEKSRTELDQKIAYTKNARLEAALLAVGALDSKGMAGAL